MKKRIQGLYAITDQKLMTPKKFAAKLRQALEGGAKVVQYRDKSHHHQLRYEQASMLVELCNEYDAISIINDDIELSKTVNADGVHLGSEDDDLIFARSELGDKKIIGVSCYASIELAKQAILDSADYVAFGSIFPSSTKPQAPVAGIEVLQQAKKSLAVPVVAIGGITPDNLSTVIDTGVDSVAIISGVFARASLSNDISSAARYFAKAFN